ncbi:hypothetical protein [Shumkonia mesophila]|uniref:hypothetical protein n=1 Tax=Shumkonia mesophila TaxID=2838854 RepID=UPI002934E5FA|nr:hypothetical protein [Shumkonia mesophila]
MAKFVNEDQMLDRDAEKHLSRQIDRFVVATIAFEEAEIAGAPVEKLNQHARHAAGMRKTLEEIREGAQDAARKFEKARQAKFAGQKMLEKLIVSVSDDPARTADKIAQADRAGISIEENQVAWRRDLKPRTGINRAAYAVFDAIRAFVVPAARMGQEARQRAEIVNAISVYRGRIATADATMRAGLEGAARGRVIGKVLEQQKAPAMKIDQILKAIGTPERAKAPVQERFHRPGGYER